MESQGEEALRRRGGRVPPAPLYSFPYLVYAVVSRLSRLSLRVAGALDAPAAPADDASMLEAEMPASACASSATGELLAAPSRGGDSDDDFDDFDAAVGGPLLLIVDRSSLVGNPFIVSGQGGRRGACDAFDELLRVVVVMATAALDVGASVQALDEDGSMLQGVMSRLAQRHQVPLHRDYRHRFTLGRVWRWLWAQLAIVRRGRRLLLCCHCRDDLQCEPGSGLACHAQSLAGAIYLLATRSLPGLSRGVSEMAGDWAVADICRRWPREVARELASFSWPVASMGELQRLVELPNGAPVALCGCEFTASVREWYSHTWRRVAVSCDERASEVPGPHLLLDVRLVVHARVWDDAFFFVPCTHQTRSDTTSRDAKVMDGRTFWGIALFIYCWCVVAYRVLMEQPATVIPDFYIESSQELRPCDVGDDDSKPVCLTTRGRSAIATSDGGGGANSGHGQLRDFADADARDRWRSSWARFPRLAAAVATQGRDAPAPLRRLVYAQEIELFARRWHPRPVPYDYLNADGQPTCEADRLYQRVRGRGDGRRVHGIVPYSLRCHDGGVCPPLRTRATHAQASLCGHMQDHAP